MIGEPLYDNDLVNLGYLNTRLEGTNTLLLSKTQNFGTIPTPPYRKYDTYMGSDGIYICIDERLIGDYNAADWTKASTYVNVEDAFTQGIVTAGLLQAVNGGSYAAGITGEGTGDTSVRIWAGSTFADRADAPFRVTQGGAVNASNINITGGTLSWSELNKPTKSDLGTWTTNISDTGIYTGTLTASQVNAVQINASSIVTGTLNASLITAGTLSANRISGGTLSSPSISGGSITGSSINISSKMRVNGDLRGPELTNTAGGFLTLGNGNATHPWASGLNINCNNGISFYTGGGVTDGLGTYCGNVKANSYRSIFITAPGTVNINNGTGGAVGIRNISIDGSTITGGNGGFMYANSNCMFAPASGYYAYINSTASGNRIAVSSGGPSSRNVKKNIKNLSNEEYQNIYKDIQQLNTHTFQYKYDNIKEFKDDFGFIIDEIEALPTISKYARNYETVAYVRNNRFIPKRDDDKKQDNLKVLEYKEWDRDSYIKTLLLMIKSMQIKIDELETKIKGGE